MVANESGKYSVNSDKVPLTRPEENTVSDSIMVTFNTSDLQMLLIDRTTRQTGSLRHENQADLLLLEDMEAEFATMFAQKKLIDRIEADKKTQKMTNEFSAFFRQERDNLKTYFKDEISEHFDADPKAIDTFEIHQPAILDEKSPFEYRSVFSMEDFVQKAGNNYLLEVGKLVGSVDKIEDKERNRTMDIYGPSPSIYSWNISVNIPAGYHVSGIEELNKTVSNETGSFSCSAATSGSSVIIKVSIKSEHNFYKAVNWPKILELDDALYLFSTQKLLLVKN